MNNIFWNCIGITAIAQALIWGSRAALNLPVHPLTIIAVLFSVAALIGQFFINRDEKREAGWQAVVDAPGEEIRTVTTASLRAI